MISESLKGEGEPSAVIASDAGQRSMLRQSIISLSFRSQSSTDSYDTVLEPCSTNGRRSEACQNDQPDNITHSLQANKHDQSHNVRSSCDVSEVTHESMFMSPRQYPPLQVMDRSAANELDRISPSVYTPNNTPQKWSVTSTESLFSLHEGRSSAVIHEMASNRPSLAAGPERARTDKGREQSGAGPSMTDNITTPDVEVQKFHGHIDANARIPEISFAPHKGKIQPLPPSANKKPEKRSSRCKNWTCCLCSCKTLSCTCCCPSSGSCCSKPKCSCCKMPSFCSLKWCCSWKCCSKKTCCSGFNCCSKWSCSCPKKSCCPSSSSCFKVTCCWNWSCWKLLCSWNCKCCAKTSCCCPSGSCCKSWSCCFSKGTCWFSWNCCSKGSCCKSWKC